MINMRKISLFFILCLVIIMVGCQNNSTQVARPKSNSCNLNSCTIGPGFACDDFVFGETELKLVIRNGLGEAVTAQNVKIEECPTIPNLLLKEGINTIILKHCKYHSNPQQDVVVAPITFTVKENGKKYNGCMSGMG